MNPPLPSRPISLILRSPESALHWIITLLYPRHPQKFSSKILSLIGNSGVINSYHRKILNTITYQNLVYEEDQLKVVYDNQTRLLIVIFYSALSSLCLIGNKKLFHINILWLLLLFFRFHCVQNIYNESHKRIYSLYRSLCKKLEE